MYTYIYIYIHRSYFCLEGVFFRNDGDTKPFYVIFMLLLRPWDLSYRVERQKLMVNSRKEMPMRVQKGGFVANLLVR